MTATPKHPARPAGRKIDIPAFVRENAARFPKILARLRESERQDD